MRRNGIHQRLGILALAALVLTALPPPRAAAAEPDTVSSKQAEAAELAAQLAGLSQRVSRLAEEFNHARVEAEAVESEAEEAREELRRTERHHRAAEQRLREQAIDAYVRGGNVALASAAVGTVANAADTLLRRHYVGQVLERQQDAIEALADAKVELAQRHDALDEAQDRWRAALGDLEDRRADAEVAVAAQQRALARAEGELAALVRAEAQRRQAEEARRAAAALAERRAREEAARRASSPTSSPAPRESTTATTSRPTSPPPAPADGASAAVAEARRQIGKPYEWGGSGPDTFDCSGLTAWAWKAGGRTLSHSSRAQYGETARVSIADLRPGDLLFYGNPIHHVGIYVGDGKMIEASETGTPVRYASINRSDFAGAGRVR